MLFYLNRFEKPDIEESLSYQNGLEENPRFSLK